MAKRQTNIKLINWKTGESVSAKNVKEFCNRIGWDNNEKFHLHYVLNGKRIHFKNWLRPKTYKKLSKKIKWYHVNGSVYKLSLLDIIEGRKMQKLGKSITAILNGEESSLFGFHLDKPEGFTPKRPIIYNFELNSGEKVSIAHLKDCSEKLGICNKSGRALSGGLKPRIKGVSFNSVEYKKDIF